MAKLAKAMALVRAARPSGLHARPLLGVGKWRAYSDAKPPVVNPFEIQLNLPALKADGASPSLSLDDAKRAAAAQKAEAEREINLLHREMQELFGEQVAEAAATTDAPFEPSASSAAPFELTASPAASQTSERSARVERQEARLRNAAGSAGALREPKRSNTAESHGGERQKAETPRASAAPVLSDVLLLQGPCSFVRGSWTGGDLERQELRDRVHAKAGQLKFTVSTNSYNAEAGVLNCLLETEADQVVILCWNISLAGSPMVRHALELIKSRVIIVSPAGVEHGRLPPNVVGVMSGFWNQSISLALTAAKHLREPSEFVQRELQGLKGGGKKETRTCRGCGQIGHLWRNCPNASSRQGARERNKQQVPL